MHNRNRYKNIKFDQYSFGARKVCEGHIIIFITGYYAGIVKKR